MDKQILNFTVNEQILVCENPIKISTNKVNYIQAHFNLGENWSGFDSVRAVWFNDFNCISTVLDSLGNCAVPFEVMKRKGNVKVNLVGSISEDDVLTDRLTSYPVVAVIVDCTAQITGANTSPITPSEYEQFVAAVHEDAERAEAGATASEQSADNSAQYAQASATSAQSAHDDKIAIEEAIAEVIQQIEDFEQVQVVVNTLPPSSQATSDFADGVLTLGIPQGVKGDTGNGIQSIAKVSTSGLVDTYRITYTDGQTTTFTVTNGAKGDTGNGISSIEKTSTVGLVDTYTITYTNGTTSTFTVTNGEKGDKGDTGEVSLSELEDATVVQTLSDTEPYNYRRTNNGNGSGTREYDEIVGASVGWNQLVGGNEKSGSGTATSNYATIATLTLANDIIPVGHKMIALGRLKSTNGALAWLAYSTSNINQGGKAVTGSTSFQSVGFVYSVDSNYTGRRLRITGMSGDTVYWENVMLIDLTLAFGSTIADYVYTLEQSTAGSGVTWLKTHFPKLFDNGYQPFDSGSIKSVSGLTAHEMVGVNQWDEEWETGYYDGSTGAKIADGTKWRCKNLVKLMGETYYYFKGQKFSEIGFRFYDANKNYLGFITFGHTDYDADNAFVFKVPSKAYYGGFFVNNASSPQHDVCINISDANKNGQYEPYEKHTYPLDSSVTLRGKYVLDNGQLKAVGDVWHSDGTKDVNYAEVDLGTLPWSYSPAYKRFQAQTTDLKHIPAGQEPNLVCAKYVGKTANYFDAHLDESGIMSVDNRTNMLYIRDLSYDSGTAFATAVSGIKLVFEKSSTTTETATPYTNPQWCDANGTEEYVGSELPVGHNTDYPMTLIDTADGLSNGTYEPRITVANGKKTVTWVSV